MAGAAGLAGVLGGKSLAALAAGLTVGIVGGSTLVATGAVSFDGSGGTTGQADTAVLAVYPCPDQIIVTQGNSLMKPIHDRMPEILRDDPWDHWLTAKDISIPTALLMS